MLNDDQIIEQSLINNLYYLRTLREFCTNIELTFLNNNSYYINIAKDFGKKAEDLGKKTLEITDKKINNITINNELFVTKYSLQCEELTNKLFNSNINIDLTKNELELKNNQNINTKEILNKINDINNNAIIISQNFVDFCDEILNKLNLNELFSYSYPKYFQYMKEEINIYILDLKRIINKESVSPIYIAGYEYYSSDSIEKTAEFIRSWVDPNYEDILDACTYFINRFKFLTSNYLNKSISPEDIENINKIGFEVTTQYKEFVSSIINRLLNNEIYFDVPPTTLDNIYTAINFFIYIVLKK